MKINNFTLIYVTILMVISQTQWAKSVVFLSIPILLYLAMKLPEFSKVVFSKLIYLLLIIFVGLISGIVHLIDRDLYLFSRDILYFTQATLFILLGVYLYSLKQDIKVIFILIIITSSFISLYNLFDLVMNPSLIFQLGLQTRYEYTFSNATAMLAFIILFYAKTLQYNVLSYRIDLMLMCLSLISVALSFSRTFYLILFITLILPYIRKNKIVVSMYGASVLLVLFVVFGGGLIDVPISEIKQVDFQAKLMNSLNEMTVREYYTLAEINQHWRGYEAYLGLSQYQSGNLLEIIFGQGFGAVTYTPFWIFRGEKLDLLPFFHNGYITIILKTGLVGLLCFFLFLYTLLKSSLKTINFAKTPQEKISGLLLQAAVFIIFFQTFVVHGIFKTTTPVLLLVLIGALLSFTLETNRKQRNY